MSVSSLLSYSYPLDHGRRIILVGPYPTPADVVSVRATETEEVRIDYLTAYKNSGVITPKESDELKECLLAHHMIVIAKVNGLRALSDD